MLQIEKFRKPVQVVVVRVGEGHNIERVFLGSFQVFTQSRIELDAQVGIVLGIPAVSIIEKYLLPVFEGYAAAIGVSQRKENQFVQESNPLSRC
jgi:hypothetical protein